MNLGFADAVTFVTFHFGMGVLEVAVAVMVVEHAPDMGMTPVGVEEQAAVVTGIIESLAAVATVVVPGIIAASPGIIAASTGVVAASARVVAAASGMAAAGVTAAAGVMAAIATTSSATATSAASLGQGVRPRTEGQGEDEQGGYHYARHRFLL